MDEEETVSKIGDDEPLVIKSSSPTPPKVAAAGDETNHLADIHAKEGGKKETTEQKKQRRGAGDNKNNHKKKKNNVAAQTQNRQNQSQISSNQNQKEDVSAAAAAAAAPQPPPQDLLQPRRKRQRVSRGASASASKDAAQSSKNANIKITSYGNAGNNNAPPPPPPPTTTTVAKLIAAAAAAKPSSPPAAPLPVAPLPAAPPPPPTIPKKPKKLKPKPKPLTRILLAPPKLHPSDLLHDYTPLKDGEWAHVLHTHPTDQVHCNVCRGRRDAAALENDEPVLLCEQRGCNAEYHLGCLYNVRPRLFPLKMYDRSDSIGSGNANSPLSETTTTHHKRSDDEEGSDDNGIDPPSSSGSKSSRSSRHHHHTPPPLAVPDGDIFCRPCFLRGATTVLERYFDRIDYERSHHSCSRAYVSVLLERHMRENPDGNVHERSLAQEKAGMGEARLRPPPRSELWYVGELTGCALRDVPEEGGREDDGGGAGGDGAGFDEGVPAVGDAGDGGGGGNAGVEEEDVASAEFLLGKPVRLYNNLDNEYHVGRIVDWRTCTVYPPRSSRSNNNNNDVKKKSSNNHHNKKGGDGDNTNHHNGPPAVAANNNKTVHLKDLDYYGTHPISTSEFLVRFPSGLQGRKQELLRWIVLEEHSLAVGISLIQGKTIKLKSGSNVNNGWKPAMILARSALELVTVRQFLHEDEAGNLFAEMKIKGSGSPMVGDRDRRSERNGNRGERNGKGGSGSGSGSKKEDRWALASFFGEEQHALLRLRDEARHLLARDELAESSGKSASAGSGGNGGSGEISPKIGEKGDAHGQSSQNLPSLSDNEEGVNHSPMPRQQYATVDVPSGLALAELGEQQRCREWCMRILHNSAHRRALVCSDEYSVQLKLERGVMLESPKKKNCNNKYGGGSSLSAAAARSRRKGGSGGKSSSSMAGGASSASNNIRPLVERGLDRLWLARLVENASLVSRNNDTTTDGKSNNNEQRRPKKMSKDTLMSFKCENVSSVSKAMAMLQRQ